MLGYLNASKQSFLYKFVYYFFFQPFAINHFRIRPKDVAQKMLLRFFFMV